MARLTLDSLILVPGLLGLLVVLLAMPGVITLAHRKGWVSRPRIDRWSSRPVALTGGIGLFAGLAAAALAWLVLGGTAFPLWLVAGAVLSFAMGLCDDLVEVRPVTKLLAQLVAAALPIAAGVRFGDSLPLVVSIPLTLLWIVGVTNAINLIDGMDGLAGGITAIAAAFLAFLAAALGAPEIAACMTAVALAALGFLAYNHRPARVFMGDSGSLLLGYLLAAGALLIQPLGEGRLDRIAVVLVPIAVLAVPILDTAFVTILRLNHGRSVSTGGNDHLMHRLVHLGLSESRTVALLWGISALAGGLAVSPLFVSPTIVYLFATLFVGFLIVLAAEISNVDVYGHSDVSPDERLAVNRLGTLFHAMLGREWKALLGMVGDLVVVVVALYGAYLLHGRTDLWLRFESAGLLVPVAIVLKLGIFYAFSLYRGIWRYAGTPEMLRIAAATCVASVFVWGFDVAYDGAVHLRVEVAIIDAILTFFGLAMVRVGVRGLRHTLHTQRAQQGERVLLYGAGDAGLLLLRELRQNPDRGLAPVGFLDDDPLKQGMSVQGVRVLGGVDDLLAACGRTRATTVVLTAPHRVSADRRRRIEAACDLAGVDCHHFSILLGPDAAYLPAVDSRDGANAELSPA